MESDQPCPICGRLFSTSQIQIHVNRCLFLSESPPTGSAPKKFKSSQQSPQFAEPAPKSKTQTDQQKPMDKNKPLAEKMRPKNLDEYIGQNHILGENKMLRQLILNGNIPSMILWGPPGCGKTSLANLISTTCAEEKSLKFIKMSATTSGVNDVKELVNIAKNELKYKRRTVLFMDEIHRFNKLQQDTFLPHIENGTIILIGATTENPSFSLNSALLSRCRVFVLEKLSIENVTTILINALENEYDGKTIATVSEIDNPEFKKYSVLAENKTIEWLAHMSDGDARIALNGLQIAFQMKNAEDNPTKLLSLDNIKDGIKRSHLLYDRKGEEHYNIISALHKSIRASDDNAALYWLTRMMQGGEDPLYIARRLVRIAGEDIGLADPRALPLTVSCMQGCQLIGMPECDVLLAECVTYLARAKKSTEVYRALGKCKKVITDHKGPLPSVPLHLRNAPTKLTKELGYGKGYNTLHKDKSDLTYLPPEMNDVHFFE